MLMATTATKAATVFLTGTATWAGVNLPAPLAGAVGVIVATILAFLVPNTTTPEPDPKPWSPLTLGKVPPDAGQVTSGGLVLLLIGFLLGALAAHAHIFGL